MSPSTDTLATSILEHGPNPQTFSFTPFLKSTYNHRLLPTNPTKTRPQCPHYLQGHCPLGSSCPSPHDLSSSSSPNHHHTYSSLHGGPGSAHHHHPTPFNSLVCKHWLRGLCKKGTNCEFLHEYNLRKMPECNFFLRNGYCSNGDECLYLHIDPSSKLPPCPHYERGFCPLGPNCGKKHVRRKLCVYYLAGFCPDGKMCREGSHPKWKTDAQLGEPVPKSAYPPPGAAMMGGRRGDDDMRGGDDDGTNRERGDGGEGAGGFQGRDRGYGRDHGRDRQGDHDGQRRWRGASGSRGRGKRGGRGGRGWKDRGH